MTPPPLLLRIRDYSAKTLTPLTFVAAFLAIMTWVQLEQRARLTNRLPPPAWATAAKTDDRLYVPGYPVTYWGKPGARYSRYATRGRKPPRAVVVHHTSVKPVLRLVKYGHRRDFNRGGASFGYHFYIGRGGRIAQGAPLSKRTNHIKSIRKPQRTDVARHLWSGNTIGISLVGGCDSLLRPNSWAWHRNGYGCATEFTTKAQREAGHALIRAIQKRFNIPCREVYSHGELQTDRANIEGATLTRLARAACPAKNVAEGKEENS